MYKLRELNGSYKGLAGECMFKLTRKWAVLPKFFNKNRYFLIFGKHLDGQQSEFIRLNWYSIDSIEISFKGGIKEITLFEIKTKNVYSKELFYKPKMTFAVHNLFNTAKSIGFNVKLALVKFYDNWDYDVEMLDFNECNYCIDKPKQYDSKRIFIAGPEGR